MFRKFDLKLVLALVAVATVSFIPALADGGTVAKVRAYTVTCNSTVKTLAATTGYTPGNAFKFKVSGGTVFFGGTDVDTNTTTGYSFADGAEDTFDAKPGAVSCKASGTVTVNLLAGSF